MKWALASMCCIALFSLPSQAAIRGLAEDGKGPNEALLVSVSHGLPGLDIDMDNMERMATHSAFGFGIQRLEEAKGVGSNVLNSLEDLASRVGRNGTLLFYYTGHGSPGSLYLEDGDLEIRKIRAAMERGRRALGPMARLVVIVDACFSGSLLSPLRQRELNRRLAQELETALSPALRGSYWKKLLVIASSRANETSLAGVDGSVFTNAFHKAFQETENLGGSMGDLVQLTQDYTEGHHPVARFVPASLASELLVP